MQCVVAENIHSQQPPPPTPPHTHTHTEIPRGGGVQKKAIPEGLGGCLQRFFPGGLSKVGG